MEELKQKLLELSAIAFEKTEQLAQIKIDINITKVLIQHEDEKLKLAEQKELEENEALKKKRATNKNTQELDKKSHS